MMAGFGKLPEPTELAHNFAEILHSPYRGKENSAEEPQGLVVTDDALMLEKNFRSSFEQSHCVQQPLLNHPHHIFLSQYWLVTHRFSAP